MIRRRSAPAKLAARLGLFAVLFQAMLFAWHHHDPIFSGRLPAPIIEKAAVDPQPAVDEDGCEICQVLHHLTAAPVAFIAAPPPFALAGFAAPRETGFAARTLALAFRARAPPLA